MRHWREVSTSTWDSAATSSAVSAGGSGYLHQLQRLAASASVCGARERPRRLRVCDEREEEGRSWQLDLLAGLDEPIQLKDSGDGEACATRRCLLHLHSIRAAAQQAAQHRQDFAPALGGAAELPMARNGIRTRCAAVAEATAAESQASLP